MRQVITSSVDFRNEQDVPCTSRRQKSVEKSLTLNDEGKKGRGGKWTGSQKSWMRALVGKDLRSRGLRNLIQIDRGIGRRYLLLRQSFPTIPTVRFVLFCG